MTAGEPENNADNGHAARLSAWTRRDLVLRGSAAALGVLAGPALAACGGSARTSSTSGKPVRGGTLVEGYQTDVQTLDPWLAVDTASFIVTGLLWDGLFGLDASQNAVPLLVTSVPQPSNNNELVFELKDGLKWSDGTALTADDVAFTYNLLIDPRYSDYNAVVRPQLTAAIKSVKASDSRTVVMKLKNPFPAFFSNYGLFGILPQSALGHLSGKQLNTASYFQNPTPTCGPFTFGKWAHGQQVTLNRNPHYHSQVYLDRYVFRVLASALAVGAALSTREIDLGVVDLSQLAALSHKNGVTLTPFSTGQVWTVFYQLRPSQPASRIFGDVNVRQALRYAVDYDGIIKTVFFGNGKRATSPFRPSTWAFDSKVGADVTYDPAKAESMLDSAGWTKGASGRRSKNGVPLAFELLTSNASSLYTGIVQVLQSEWNAIGANVSIRAESQESVLAAAITKHTFDAVMLPYQDTGDPDATTIWWDSTQAGPNGLNICGLNNPTVDSLIHQAASSWSQSERGRLYDRLQSELVAITPAAWLVYGTGEGGTSDSVHNFTWSESSAIGSRPWFASVYES